MEKKESCSGEIRSTWLLAKDKKVHTEPKVTTFNLAKEFNPKDANGSSNEDTKDEEFQAEEE